MKLVLACQDLSAQLGQLRGNVDLGLTLDLTSLNVSDMLTQAVIDSKKMSKLLQENRQELAACVSSFTAGDFEKANSLLSDIGGTEKDFLNEKGGAWALVVLVVLVVMLAATPAKGSGGGAI